MSENKRAIDLNKEGLNYLTKIHGIPVIETPHIKEPTFLVPIGYGEKIMKEQLIKKKSIT